MRTSPLVVIQTIGSMVSIVFLIYVVTHVDSLKAKTAWETDLKQKQPLWTGDPKNPMARIMNELPVLPQWDIKIANEILEYARLAYPPSALTPDATLDDIKNMQLSTQAMATICLRMETGSPIDKGAAQLLKEGLVEKLSSPMSLDRLMAMACLLNSGLMVDPDVLHAVENMQKDPVPEVKRAAQQKVEYARRPEYISTFQKFSQLRGY